MNKLEHKCTRHKSASAQVTVNPPASLPPFPLYQEGCRGVSKGDRVGFSAICYLLFLLSTFTNHLSASSEEARIFLNAATEVYIRGDFDSAVSNIEKALSLAPENQRIKDFGSKIFYDGAKSLHISRNYRKAFQYLQRAVELNPDDGRIRELHDVTRDLLESAAPGIERREKPPPEPLAPSQKRAVAAQRAPTVVKYQPAPPPAEKPVLSPMYLITFVSSFALNSIMLAAIVFFFSRIKKLKKENSLTVSQLKEAESEKMKTTVEFEKMKESLKYEQNAVIKLQKELKDERAMKNKQFEQQLKFGMDIRQMHLGELLKSGVKNKQEAEIHSRRAKVCELIGDASCIDEESSSSLEMIRERIAMQSLDLYKTSPSACFEFLKEMASNPNPLVRANIAKALSNLAKPESIELLLVLVEDPFDKVKREALRELKNLKNKIDSGKVTLSPAYFERIKKAIEDEKSAARWIF